MDFEDIADFVKTKKAYQSVELQRRILKQQELLNINQNRLSQGLPPLEVHPEDAPIDWGLAIQTAGKVARVSGKVAAKTALGVPIGLFYFGIAFAVFVPVFIIFIPLLAFFNHHFPSLADNEAFGALLFFFVLVSAVGGFLCLRHLVRAHGLKSVKSAQVGKSIMIVLKNGESMTGKIIAKNDESITVEYGQVQNEISLQAIRTTTFL